MFLKHFTIIDLLRHIIYKQNSLNRSENINYIDEKTDRDTTILSGHQQQSGTEHSDLPSGAFH